ncbi:hypothetical protein JTE90_019323 [Oedothorax gibbosus]|uniref:Hexosyltransferase n=1 Tax=Oedothorax gibbosus TaxID=931172 RepID=A0AAV6ULX9_9ARAC|nr:hypothetical protein JTE90_019323 [Oedothorax gibbosus]
MPIAPRPNHDVSLLYAIISNVNFYVWPVYRYGEMKKLTEKVFTKSLVFYCLCAIVFVVGYFVGVLQCIGWCNEITYGKKLYQVEKQTAYLAVIIFSAPGNYERRRAIRKTWLLNKGDRSIGHFFVVGTASLESAELNNIQHEHEEFGDLMVLDKVSDSYAKLSVKLREALTWLYANVEFVFLLKVDDDSFVRLGALYNELKLKPKEKLYWGFFDGQAKVKFGGKWKETAWFLCDRYLPYAKGGGYVITSDLVRNLALTSSYLSLYQNEDVALGTWLAPFDIKRVHDPNFDTEYLSRGCFNSYLVTHKQSISLMITKFKNLKETGNMCTSERRERNSYMYNWRVQPSLCCIRNNSQIP